MMTVKGLLRRHDRKMGAASLSDMMDKVMMNSIRNEDTSYQQQSAFTNDDNNALQQ